MSSRRPVLVLLAGAAAVALAACGSSTSGSSTTADAAGSTSSPPATAAPQAPPSAVPSTVGADAVPAVTGPQGSKPTIAKPSGPAPTALLVHDVIVGTGATATDGSKVTVHYTGAVYATGAVFQSSYDGGQPFTFILGAGRVIPGFDAGVEGMKVGGRREVVIPPSLGYGAQAQAGIPANSTLIFVIDLVSVG